MKHSDDQAYNREANIENSLGGRPIETLDMDSGFEPLGPAMYPEQLAKGEPLQGSPPSNFFSRMFGW